MKNGLNDEWFEVLLKAAVIQNSMNEIEPYPPQEEIDNLQISDACDYKIRKMIKRFWRRQWLSKVQRITKKIVAVIFITVGVSFIALLQFNEVRAACYDILVRFTSRYIEIDYNAPDEELEPFNIGYVPEGFYKVEESNSASMYHIAYENENGERLSLENYKSVSVNVDNENHIITDITINGSLGQYFSATDERFENVLIWNNDKGFFIITTYLGKDEILKVAESINFLEERDKK